MCLTVAYFWSVKNVFYYFMVLLALSGLNSCGTSVPDDFVPCVTDVHRHELYRSFLHFEEALKSHYKLNNNKELYSAYLNDFARMNLPENLVSNEESFKLLNRMKLSGAFYSTFVIKKQRSKVRDDWYFYGMKFNGEYYQCLLETEKEGDFHGLLSSLIDVPTVSPGFIANGLLLTEDEKFDDINFRSFVVYYCHFMFLPYFE